MRANRGELGSAVVVVTSFAHTSRVHDAIRMRADVTRFFYSDFIDLHHFTLLGHIIRSSVSLLDGFGRLLNGREVIGHNLLLALSFRRTRSSRSLWLESD